MPMILVAIVIIHLFLLNSVLSYTSNKDTIFLFPFVLLMELKFTAFGSLFGVLAGKPETAR